MKPQAPLLVSVSAVFILIPVVYGIIVFRSQPDLFESTEIFFLSLFLLPVIAAFVGLLIISAHPRSYRFQLYDTLESEYDWLRHIAIGCVHMVLQDLSQGSVGMPDRYDHLLQEQMRQEFAALAVYRDRGFSFHIVFHHDETYQMHVVHQLSDTEAVVEIDGLFDYYFERSGQYFGTPDPVHPVDPLFRVPGVVRLRMLFSEDGRQWQLTGWSENVRGMQLGMATY